MTTLPYPTLSDAPNAPAQFQALASATTADLGLNLPRISRQVARTTTLGLTGGSWTGVATFGIGTIYNFGDITYGSGVYTVHTVGHYEWEMTTLYPSTTAAHSRGMKVLVNAADLAYNQGETWWTYPAQSVGTLTLTTQGKVPMVVGDTITPEFYSSVNMTITPLAFSLTLVG